MFNKNIKLVIAALIIAYAIYQFTEGYIGNGIMYILLSTVFIFLYFKNEFILLAFLRLRKQDFEGAKKWLDKIKNPKGALVKKQQGYLNYLNGIMVSQTNMIEAEKYFKRAIDLGLSMDHDLAMAKLNLAGIAFSRRRKQEAKKLLSEAENWISAIC
jgi:tetratricopeptide (TPR) repeat protein